jgi:hypothetical protein
VGWTNVFAIHNSRNPHATRGPPFFRRLPTLPPVDGLELESRIVHFEHWNRNVLRDSYWWLVKVLGNKDKFSEGGLKVRMSCQLSFLSGFTA